MARKMTHTRNPDEQYWCPHCATPYEFFDELQEHCRVVHRVTLRSCFGYSGGT